MWAITHGRLAHLEYGLGDDRLGGARLGISTASYDYTSSAGRHTLEGAVWVFFPHNLNIPEEHVTMMPKGNFTPRIVNR